MSTATGRAFRDISDAIDAATDFPLSDAGLNYLREWCNGTGRDHEPRPDIFVGAQGPELVADLVEVLGDVAGRFLDAAVQIRRSVTNGSGEAAVEVAVLLEEASRVRLRVSPKGDGGVHKSDLLALGAVVAGAGTRPAGEIAPADLYALSRVLGESGTRLCNEDPIPT